MESGVGLILIAVAAIVGGVAGFIIARLRSRDDDRDAKLLNLQKEYDEYRANVRNHFIETVSAIGRIDEQQRKLYQSVAQGVTELCQPDKGDDDYFIEQTMQTLGQLEPPKKDQKNLSESS